jgi:hypothetical protein
MPKELRLGRVLKHTAEGADLLDGAWTARRILLLAQETKARPWPARAHLNPARGGEPTENPDRLR